MDGFKTTPYMRDLLLYAGQEDNYETSSEHIEKYLRVKVDDSQMNRLCVHYGGLLEGDLCSLESSGSEKAAEIVSDLGSQEVVYAMFDGCMLPTRPHKDGQDDIGSWKEMKLGRIFRETDHLDLGKKPNVIRDSIYVSHFGKQEDFMEKVFPIVDPLESLQDKLVFINDGATWIENCIHDYFPKATDILDFFHASEHLHDFAKAIFSKQSNQTEIEQKTQWVEKQLIRLLNDEVQVVINEIEKMEFSGKTKLDAQAKILTYYNNNQHRMLYKTYRDRGLLIGSGPIESAHRFVLQKRMKQSGQKCTKKGGQAVANLRIFNLNNQWDKVINLINTPTAKAA